MGAGLRVVKEHAWLAHDALHKGDTDTAHGELHLALGLDNDLPTSTAAPSTPGAAAFDQGFIALCRANGVRAMYLLVEGSGRALSGGDADLCEHVDKIMRSQS